MGLRTKEEIKNSKATMCVSENEIFGAMNSLEDLQEVLCKSNGYLIAAIDHPSEEVQQAAVTCHPSAPHYIHYIDYPSNYIKMEAVKNNGGAWDYMDAPPIEVTYEAIRNYPYLVSTLKSPSKKMLEIAVTANGNVIKDILNPDEDIQLMAVEQNGYAVRHIEKPSEAVQMAAVSKCSSAIKDIIKPCLQAQLISIKKDYRNISHIRDQDQHFYAQIAAVKASKDGINYIMEPKEEMWYIWESHYGIRRTMEKE